MENTFADSLKPDAMKQKAHEEAIEAGKRALKWLSSTIQNEAREAAKNGLHSISGYFEDVEGNRGFSDNTGYAYELPLDIDNIAFENEASEMIKGLGFTDFDIQLVKKENYEVKSKTTFWGKTKHEFIPRGYYAYIIKIRISW